MVDADVDEQPGVADPRAVEDVELGLLEGGAHLFFTTFTRVRLPMISGPSLRAPIRRMSMRREA